MTPAAIQAALLKHAGELAELANHIASMVPEGCDRYDHILLAKNAAYASKARAIDAATLMGWAIRDELQMGGES